MELKKQSFIELAKGIESIIETEKAKLTDKRNSVSLARPCLINDGIIAWSDLKSRSEASHFDQNISFFVPASGAGSRMFSFLYEFYESKESGQEVDIFFSNISSFPFFDLLEIPADRAFSLEDRLKIVEKILFDPRFNFGAKPKGMIPFFKEDDQGITPFQVQAKQAKELLGATSKIHYTVASGWEKEIQKHIDSYINDNVIVDFSCQDPDSNAYCFDEKVELAVDEDGNPLRRPAGHGALLSNLNKVDADIVLIKNIDNVQYADAAKTSFECWDKMLRILSEFNELLKEAINLNSFEKLQELNEKFMFLSSSQMNKLKLDRDFTHLGDRPTRVCGMVINQGKPGGGPFWIESEGVVTKQIVEKSQINTEDQDQLDILQASTHFNPVFIAASKVSLNSGQRLDLMSFANDDLYLNVSKPHNGKMVCYSELPGLWNGGMHNWNTIFVEIPVEAFTPVKTVLDLI